MSTIKVEVTQIREVRPHNNADTLELATVGGWQMCIKKGMYKDGDPVVYFEQGTVLPPAVADRLGVTAYLSEKTDINGDRVLVIHRVRLRGEPSFGLVIAPEPGMGKQPADDETAQGNTYWFPTTLPAVQKLLQALFDQGHNQAVLYGEVYGSGIQPYTYGERQLAFRAFDLMLDGRFLDYAEFDAWCAKYGIETVPVVYRGGFTLATIKQLSEGKSLIGGAHGREGVVVRPVQERTDSKIGRVILKYIGDAYLFGKAAEQDTTDV